MIRMCTESDFDEMIVIVNDAAQAYHGVIAADCWKEPYMPKEELIAEVRHGVNFCGYEDHGRLLGIMGLQNKNEVALIRHAYVRTAFRGRGIGGKLLKYLEKMTDLSLLVGTWADAHWAVSFYQKHGFKLVTWDEKERLLRQYWSLPERQIETSVVLADNKWFDQH